MSLGKVRIFPLGDSALTVEFGNVISTALNKKAIALANIFEQARFPGFIESVPAYASTTVFYDLIAVRRNFPDFPTAFEAVKDIASKAVSELADDTEETSRTIEIPMHFDDASALDLTFVAKMSRLSPDEVVEIFMCRIYRVFMIGFLPGFSYMGEVDERIVVLRKESPRLLVPKGSVGIAGKQTGIYSLASPGGWQIIGRTALEMFTPGQKTPSLLRAGDLVRFVKADHQLLLADAQACA